MASNGVTRPPALDVTMQEILDALKAVSFRPQVIDNLTSQDTGAPLSANQGRVLKSAIDGLVTQSITDGDTAHAPSGDAVHDAINAISDVIPKTFYRTVSNSGYYNFSINDSSIKAGEYYVGFWTDANSTQKHGIYTATAGKIEFGDANTLKQGSDIIAIQVKSKN